MKRFALAAIAVGIFAVVGPADAININQLLWEQNFIGGAGGGNPTDAQINQLIADNEALLGADIDLIGKVDSIDSTPVFIPRAGSNFQASMFLDLTCFDPSCHNGFQVDFDFSPLVRDWQIVKIAVKAAGPTHPNGVFFIDPAVFDPANATDPIQRGVVSGTEWAKYCEAAGGVSPCSFNPDASHFLVFGSPTAPQVPEPATLTFLGLGLIGIGVAVRRQRSR